MNRTSKILVIRLGALGDFIQSFYPFAAIRQYHAQDEITLLTTAPFVELAQHSPWFNSVIVDDKPHKFNIVGRLKLQKKLQGFDFVYDLQTSGRSSQYFKLAGKPRWSGIAKGSSHPHDNPNRNEMHTIDRQKDQLQRAGITDFPEPDLSWLAAETGSIHKPYAILVPGCSIKRPEKRWPVEYYGEIAKLCVDKSIQPVVVGSHAEQALVESIQKQCPQIISLIGQTTLLELSAIMKKAKFALGNDTGPMHLGAMVGCPSVVLFSSGSDPLLTAPRGRDVKIIYKENLKDLSVKKVAQALKWVH
ncbi:glycosyltransferase family 9 protein [Commensalibacter papalotli (ex Botero et al. 2024)]|uniref:ADP-heptose:LPS heptosyltransferase (RfaF) (PDB:1PSW) n=1 Tax=Commensalibacter papalotli (ex Botero et al. 2024) TaxID=2972766 RepID=A0ABN8W9H8_9PROT|nr:glycosyltransferase family 9 protein [Commensalibacter papalotli (ex Botero et al. 2024)]CAI3936488.1 ADP-heptose:LPS heptosyltransferase (RfaF) (PDB:1PSW) [Commensalibacter papalotli (ex Botero et al. 2024)]CAI3939173.1 ADP-heptose:LPS heptosyltransferase (RfaF) (PDB:1PSW) [Commensalibacter papalotli (ex Botero et al. 2024)]